MSEKLAFKGFLHSFLCKIRATKVLVSRTVLKICCKSSFEYLTAENEARSSGAELKAEDLSGIGGISNSSISLSIKKGLWDVKTKSTSEGATVTRFFQKRWQLWIEVILWF